MNLRHVLALGLVAALASCSKDKSAESNNNQNNDTASYQPVTGGSTWHYKDTTNPNGGYTLTATGKDTVVGGISYHIFNNKPDTSSSSTPSLFGQHGHDYYTIGLISALGTNPLLYLKDTTANATWSQNLDISVPTLGNITATLNFKLTGVNTTVKLNGKTFNFVDEVSLQLNVPSPIGGGPIPYANGKIYFARGIGVIEVTLQENGSTVSDVILDSYTIH